MSLTMRTSRAARVYAAAVAGSLRSGSGRSSSSSQRWCSRTLPVSPRLQGAPRDRPRPRWHTPGGGLDMRDPDAPRWCSSGRGRTVAPASQRERYAGEGNAECDRYDSDSCLAGPHGPVSALGRRRVGVNDDADPGRGSQPPDAEEDRHARHGRQGCQPQQMPVSTHGRMVPGRRESRRRIEKLGTSRPTGSGAPSEPLRGEPVAPMCRSGA